MEYVQPIRKKADIEAMKNLLRSHNLRDYALFVLGINSGLRISDILKLHVADVARVHYGRTSIAERIVMREDKTGKGKDFPLNVPARSALGEYIRTENPDLEGPLFPSRKRGVDGKARPISKVQAWKILSNAAAQVGITEKVGTHSLRKTFAYHAYKKGVDISLLQKLLNHASQTETLRYMGILRDDLDQVYEGLRL